MGRVTIHGEIGKFFKEVGTEMKNQVIGKPKPKNDYVAIPRQEYNKLKNKK